MTFALDLQRFAEKAKDKADQAVGKIVFDIAAELDRRSPVGDATYWQNPPPAGYVGGHFRANWQLGVDVRLTGEVPGVVPGDHAVRGNAGGAAIARIHAAIPDDASGKIYNLSNNVPYAMRLEMGHSRQAPQGLVALTAANFQQIVRESVEAVQ